MESEVRDAVDDTADDLEREIERAVRELRAEIETLRASTVEAVTTLEDDLSSVSSTLED
ncbi:MAG: hypothetical protein ACLFU0_02275 [Alphaproteobacteria bacterium]